jgi:hypothetical protein
MFGVARMMLLLLQGSCCVVYGMLLVSNKQHQVTDWLLSISRLLLQSTVA